MSNTPDTEKKTIVVTPDDAEQGRQVIEQYYVNNSEYPWPNRALLKYMYSECDMTQAEIAEELYISRGTVGIGAQG